jgi:hypothetical protein
VINAIELAFLHGPEIPEAGENLLDGLGKMSFVGSMGAGIVKPRSTESRQVFVVGA